MVTYPTHTSAHVEIFHCSFFLRFPSYLTQYQGNGTRSFVFPHLKHVRSRLMMQQWEVADTTPCVKSMVLMLLFSDGTTSFSCPRSENVVGVSCLIKNDFKLHPNYSHRISRPRLSTLSCVTIERLFTKEALRREQLWISCHVCNVATVLNDQAKNVTAQCLIFKHPNYVCTLYIIVILVLTTFRIWLD